MLVLSRKVGERIVIGENIVITVTSLKGDRVKLGIQGPPEVPIHREEVRNRVVLEGNLPTTTARSASCLLCS